MLFQDVKSYQFNSLVRISVSSRLVIDLIPIGFVIFLYVHSLINFITGALVLGISCAKIFVNLLVLRINTTSYNDPKVTLFLIMS